MDESASGHQGGQAKLEGQGDQGDHHDYDEYQGAPTEEEISECDWAPPAEVEIVESEVFNIPSGLPSLECFIQSELEKEAAAAAAEPEEAEAVKEEAKEVQESAEAGETKSEEGSVQEGPEDDAAGLATEELKSDDEYEMPEPETKPKPKVVKKPVADDWMEMTMKIDFGDAAKEVESKEKEEMRLMVVASTHNYIFNIINKVVEMCEYEDPEEVLRTRLDKAKVRKDLEDKLNQLDLEQKVRLFLNRKVIEHFRRKKAMRPLTDDSPETILTEMRKYRTALLMLNRVRGREEATRAMVGKSVTELTQEKEQLVEQSRALTNELEYTVRKTFSPEGCEKMDALIDLLMGKMRNVRREISNVRFVLIQRQHTMATLQDKARKLEDLGNGLRMIDYEHLQTETQALGKKIEERNNELNRLHMRYNADIHNLAHIREKQHMIRNTINVQEEAYEELIEEKQLSREGLNRLKLDRGSIRRELQQLSFENGLLDKPDLLVDYDTTKEKVDQLRAKIDEIKAAQAVVDDNLKYMMELLQ